MHLLMEWCPWEGAASNPVWNVESARKLSEANRMFSELRNNPAVQTQISKPLHWMSIVPEVQVGPALSERR